jgi:hypothetical protein
VLDLTRYATYQLRGIQDGAAAKVVILCAEASDISKRMTAVSPGQPGSDERYRGLWQQWQVKIAQAHRYGDLIPAITAELERRAQQPKAG